MTTAYKNVAQIQLGGDEASAKILGESLSQKFGAQVEAAKLDGVSLIQLYPHRDLVAQDFTDAGLVASINTLQPSAKGETYLIARQAPAPTGM